jgi:hypothetical protein
MSVEPGPRSPSPDILDGCVADPLAGGDSPARTGVGADACGWHPLMLVDALLSPDLLDARSVHSELFSECFGVGGGEDEGDFFVSPSSVRAAPIWTAEISSPPNNSAVAAARTAAALPVGDGGILGIVNVASWAMRDTRRRPRYILRMGDRFEMARIAAVPDTTEMVDFQSLGDQSDIPLVHHPVHVEGATGSTCSSLHGDASVSTTIRGSGPQPAFTCSIEAQLDAVDGIRETLFP